MKDSNKEKEKDKDRKREKDYPIPIEDVWKVMENKYKAIVIASKDARNIFEFHGDKGDKASILALKNLIRGKLKYEEGPSGSNG